MSERQFFIVVMSLIVAAGVIAGMAIHSHFSYHKKLLEDGYVEIFKPQQNVIVRVKDGKIVEE